MVKIWIVEGYFILQLIKILYWTVTNSKCSYES